MLEITSFHGEFRFLSNFWRADILYHGRLYPTVEHAYQAGKISPFLLNACELQRQIAHARTPGQAKRLGRMQSLPDNWDETKLDFMHTLITLKFHHTFLARKLLTTGEALLIEGNNWGDRYWGIDGWGENHLGRLLMDTRSRLRHTEDKQNANHV